MCKFCEQQIYFSKNWAIRDAGYGDTDYGGITIKQLLNKRICPVCGKILLKDEEARKAVIKDFFAENLSEITYEEFQKIIADNSAEYFEKTLELNNLKILSCNPEVLVCSCGKEFDAINKPISSISDIILAISENNFCNKCGRKILPLKHPPKGKEHKVIDSNVESIKTWDRSE